MPGTLPEGQPSTRGMTRQQALTLLAPVRSPERVPAHLVSLCRSSGEAIGDYRKALGAIHCVEHAAELEQRRGLR